MVFLGVNPRIWLVLGALFAWGLCVRQWKSWRARRQVKKRR